jgi:hypothetical protein
LAAIATVVALAGCVSAKYKLAKKETPPTALNFRASQPAAETVLHTVIAYDGPGSWKRKAFWDEYVLTVANRSGLPLTIESATLLDYQDQRLSPGSEPWSLEKQSKTWWQNVKSNDTGRLLTLGAGTVVVGTAVVATAGTVVLGGAAGGIAAGAAAVGAAAIALPIYAVVSVVGNVKGRHRIEAEFNRRRLVLPATIPPGQSAEGSLFFRISPGPKRLILAGRAGDEPQELTLDLAPLAGLHFKAPPSTAPPPAGTSAPSPTPPVSESHSPDSSGPPG